MKPSSAKNKGRRLQQWVCEKISLITGFEWGQDKPIESRGMGQNGVDVRLEDAVKKMFPFSVECKCQETWSVPAWIEQAKKNIISGTNWLLVISKNRASPIIVMDAEAFFSIMKGVISVGENKSNIDKELPVTQRNDNEPKPRRQRDSRAKRQW